MHRLLLASRYLVNLAVLAALLGAAAVLIYGISVLGNLIFELFVTHGFTIGAVKIASLSFIQLIDLLFLGVALYIIAVGLFHLFIDDSLHLPRWLKIDNFDELKTVLMSVVIVILAINFTGVVVNWDGSGAILELGLAIAAVIAGLGLVIYLQFVATRQAGAKGESRE
jgi:uncharacterized membrane protein YqhA